MSTIRFDRFASLHFFGPLQRRLRAQQLRIPILMYHSISADGERGMHPYFWTRTARAVFELHMRLIRANGYTVIRLEEAMARLSAPTAGAAKAVVITFDDGYRDFFTNAFPILQEHGFTATVFLPTAFIHSERRTFQGSECMAWSEVQELSRHGIHFGSHTVNHPQLRSLANGQVASELRRSKEEIEQRTADRVTTFAYPFAFPQADHRFRQFLRITLEQAGYLGGVCTMLGSARGGDDRFFLKRLPVNSDDDRSLFECKLEGGYDWLQRPQWIVSRLKQLGATA